MIQRHIAMAILGALPDDKILKALQVAGVAPVAQNGLDGLAMGPAGMGSDQSMGNAGNKIEPWSQKKMPYTGGKDRPPLIDRMWAKPQMNAQVPVAGGALDAGPGQDVFMQTGGM